MYTVYKITNNLNGKYYIGVHKTKNPYDDYYGSGSAIKIAIKKYGKKNFTKTILLITENIEEAYKLEFDLTESYKSINCYNLIRGGIQTPPANLNLIEKRKKAGALGGRANKGLKRTNTHKENISASLIGKQKKYKKNRKSRTLSEETKEKLRKIALERWNKSV